MTLFSIIIPFQRTNNYLAQTLDEMERQTERSFEVLLLPDEATPNEDFGSRSYPIRVIPTGPVSPAIKRDEGADEASGDYLAFIDDDAYPEPEWLEMILNAYTSDDIAAVVGPQLTPDEDGFSQKVSGAVFLSSLNGSAVYRYWQARHSFDVDDWPSVNLCVKKSDFFAVGKFNSAYWPGEDTILCLELVHTLKKRIVYTPSAVVRHHRRAGLKKHLRQIGGYALHRGYFARRFPENSRNISYFLPSAFVLFACLGWIMLWGGKGLAGVYLTGWLTYLCGLLVSAGSVQARTDSWSIALSAQFYIFLTHIWYGINFARGFICGNVGKHGLGR